jgi:hypothetical protein
MSSDVSPSGVNEERIRRLESKFDEFQKASSSLRSTSRVMSLLLVMTSVGLVIRMLMPIWSLYDNRNVLATHMVKDLEARVLPTVKIQAEKLYEEDLKEWLDAEVKLRKDKTLPKVMSAMEAEAGQLLTDLTNGMQGRLQTEAEKFNARTLVRLEKAFPELADDDHANELITKMQGGLESASDRILDDFFSMHRKALLEMGKTYDKIEVPDNVAAMSNDELVHLALGQLADIVAVRFDIEGEFTLHSDGAAMDATSSAP